MNHRPKVSIITPSYNQGEFIEDTILSIKGQTYRNFEHIVVDGGSTDNTLDILRKYAGTYDLSWSSEPDEGMYQAINKGLKKAKGDILCYLNTDDLYLPWTLEAVAGYSAKNKQVDLLYGDIINLDDDKGTIELTFSPPFNLRWAIVKGGLYQPTVFWSRRAYERVGGLDETLQIGGDYEYWIRIAMQGTVKKINEFLAADRSHDKRKCFVQSDLSEEELLQTRRKYGASTTTNEAQEFIYRFYGYFWTRCYMAMFIVQSLRRGGRNRRFWPHFLSVKDLHLPSTSRLLLRFLPYVGKSRGPWLVSNLPIGCGKSL
jgi:glycosyltransferase involved in cell wall biosynthesis